MTIGRVKRPGWAVNETFTSAQVTALDLAASNAVDRTSAGDTISGVISLSGWGRIIPTVALGADADTTYLISGGNLVIRVTSATTASRAYTLSATNAQHGDTITLFCESSFSSAFYISVLDQAAAEMFKLGNGLTHDGTFATFMYTTSGGTGWRLVTSPLSHMGYESFTTSGTFTAPPNVYNVLLIGWGGGGGGGCGRNGTNAISQSPRGGGGGAGALQGIARVAVTPGAAYTVTIGAGGTGGTGLGHGADGSDTTFGSLATFRGAEGGKSFNYTTDGSTGDTRTSRGGCREYASGMVYTYWENNIGPGEGGHGGVGGGLSGGTTVAGRGGGDNELNLGGLRGTNGTASGSYRGGGGGGGGGAGPGGVGAVGSAGGNGNNAGAGAAGTAGVGFSATNTGAGGGGGGAGGCGSTGAGNGADGGTGDSGKLTVIWTK